MAFSDCMYCWDTPCTCGNDYQNWSAERKKKMIKAVTGRDVNLLKECIAEIEGKHISDADQTR